MKQVGSLNETLLVNTAAAILRSRRKELSKGTEPLPRLSIISYEPPMTDDREDGIPSRHLPFDLGGVTVAELYDNECVRRKEIAIRDLMNLTNPPKSRIQVLAEDIVAREEKEVQRSSMNESLFSCLI